MHLNLLLLDQALWIIQNPNNSLIHRFTMSKIHSQLYQPSICHISEWGQFRIVKWSSYLPKCLSLIKDALYRINLYKLPYTNSNLDPTLVSVRAQVFLLAIYLPAAPQTCPWVEQYIGLMAIAVIQMQFLALYTKQSFILALPYLQWTEFIAGDQNNSNPIFKVLRSKAQLVRNA